MPQLNSSQYQASIAGDGPQLILAGAGSGKTRTIVHRIGHLLSTRGIAPHRILAVTFTNKSAQELKHRLEMLVGDSCGGVASGTFHSISLRFLRRFGAQLGYSDHAQVLDSADRIQLIKQLLKSSNISRDRLHPSYLGYWIDQCKNRGETWEQAANERCNNIPLQTLYRDYQRALMVQQRMDFSDLILNCVLLLRHHNETAQMMCNRYDHVLVDEYQDTNPAQHEWLLRLCAHHRNLTVVGDDDQSIYGWRGADVSNILCFAQQWPGAETHYLEENYRSTAAILKLANAVIISNTTRHPKRLNATRDEGVTPQLISCADEYDEARTISKQLLLHHQHGTAWSQMAILYRSNRQSLPLEKQLREADIPYRIIGGVGFFERKEIKDALAFWALLHRCGDSMQLKRIINTPRRGIGEKGCATIMQAVTKSGMSIADWLDLQAQLPSATPCKKLQPLAQLLQQLRPQSDALEDGGLWILLQKTGYFELLQAMGKTEAESRIEHLQALDDAIKQSKTMGISPAAFLDQAALLQSGEKLQHDDQDSETVSLMSLHRAKGLEFDTVFITGVEEGLLPHQKAIDENDEAIAEERRLLYVGITRAKETLILSHAHTRHFFDTTKHPKVSRFISTIDPSLLKKNRATQHIIHPQQAGNNALCIGCTVRHPSFGEGVVTALDGEGDGTRVTVEFARVHTKRLMLKFASLVIIP